MASSIGIRYCMDPICECVVSSWFGQDILVPLKNTFDDMGWLVDELYPIYPCIVPRKVLNVVQSRLSRALENCISTSHVCLHKMVSSCCWVSDMNCMVLTGPSAIFVTISIREIAGKYAVLCMENWEIGMKNDFHLLAAILHAF